MSRVTVKTVEYSVEDLIITGMIVDTPFLHEIHRAAQPEYFDTGISKILVRWILDYYFSHNCESPGDYIQEIFTLNKDELDEDEAKTTRIFLKRISDEYSGKTFNKEYVLRKALPYLEKKAYAHKIKLIDRELRRDNLTEAKALFYDTPKHIFEEMTQWTTFSDRSLIDEWWWARRESILTFPGELGRYMPRIERGRLYAMLGPPKRGKTFWLLEWAYNAAVEGLRTIIFSLEMSEKEMDTRWKEKISGQPIANGKFKILTEPIMDCKHNQSGECMRPENTGNGITVFDGKKMKGWEEEPEYKVCTFCKGTEDFKPATWIEQQRVPALTFNEALEWQRMFDNHFGEGIVQIKSFPIGTASVEDLETAMDELEYNRGFIPELVVVDYADILKEDLRLGDKRHRVGDNWRQLSRVAKVRNLCLVTASQGNRPAASKNRLTEGDVAEDFSKVMIIDGIFAINERNFDLANSFQTDAYWQTQRIETIALRYAKFIPGLQCVTTNNRERGQMCLDSYIEWK